MKIEPHIEAMLVQVELRVIYGPQSGSRLSLAPGNYLLGTGDNCGIMLSGPRMRESHASLDFDGESPSITPIDGRVFDAQGNEVQGTLALSLGMPIELGGVWITIDHVESEWPDPEAVAAIAGLATPPPPSTEAATLPEEPPETDEQASIWGKLRPAWLTASAPFVVIALLGIMAFAITAWLLKPSSSSSASGTEVDADRETDISRALREAITRAVPDHSLTVIRGSDGTMRVHGYVRDPAARTKILEAIRKHESTQAATIYADSELLAATRKIVDREADSRNVRVSVLSVTNGRAELSGAVSSTPVRDLLVERIRNEVSGIVSFSGGLLTSEDLSSLLQDRIMASGLATKLEIIERQPEFVIRGRLNEQDLARWEGLLSDFAKDYASVLPIRATIAVLRRKPPIDVQMIVGGAMPFVVTESGQRIGRGGDNNGHTLSVVGDNEVIFEGSERVRIAR